MRSKRVGKRVGRRLLVENKSSVPGVRIELTKPCGRQILSLLRLPISPPGRMIVNTKINNMHFELTEATAGIEPAHIPFAEE